MAVIRQALAVRVLLQVVHAPCAAQLGGEGAGAGEDLAAVVGIQTGEEVAQQARGVARVAQIAVAEAFLHVSSVAAQVEAFLLAALHGLAAFDAGAECIPVRFGLIGGEPLERRAALLLLVGAGSAECLVGEGIIAEA